MVNIITTMSYMAITPEVFNKSVCKDKHRSLEKYGLWPDHIFFIFDCP